METIGITTSRRAIVRNPKGKLFDHYSEPRNPQTRASGFGAYYLRGFSTLEAR